MSESAAPAPVLVNYKPSAFYFRKAIRGAKTMTDVRYVTQAVVSEFEQLHAWTLAQGLAPSDVREILAELASCRTLSACKAIGLTAVTALEDLKALVRDNGFIPPKWRVLPEEAKEKGWGSGA